MTSSHYTFSGNENSIDFIAAVGSSPTFGYHKVKASGTMFFAEVGSPTCLCNVGYDEGTLGGFAWGGQRCSAPPLGQMTRKRTHIHARTTHTLAHHFPTSPNAWHT